MRKGGELNPGEQFGRLEIVRKLPDPRNGAIVYLCTCNGPPERGCKGWAIVPGFKLLAGQVSCGCYARERAGESTGVRHGHKRRGVRSPTYRSWEKIRQRATRIALGDIPPCPIEERWVRFEAFLSDMGEKPPNTVLHRRVKAQGYTRDNCIWKQR